MTATSLLVIKLVATPAIVGLASLASRRLGPSLTGWTAGIPLTSGPLALYLALEQGTRFAADAAAGILAGLIAVSLFCTVYVRTAVLLPWYLAIAVALLAFMAATAVLQTGTLELALMAGCVVASLALALLMLPGTGRPIGASSPGAWDIPVRMALATVIVVGLTTVGPSLGPRLAGLLAPVPVYAGLMTVFAHRLEGAGAAVEVIRGVLFGTFGFGAFFLCVAAALPVAGIAWTFAAATAAAAATQAATFWLLRRPPGLDARPPPA